MHVAPSMCGKAHGCRKSRLILGRAIDKRKGTRVFYVGLAQKMRVLLIIREIRSAIVQTHLISDSLEKINQDSLAELFEIYHPAGVCYCIAGLYRHRKAPGCQYVLRLDLPGEFSGSSFPSQFAAHGYGQSYDCRGQHQIHLGSRSVAIEYVPVPSVLPFYLSVGRVLRFFQ